MEDIQTVYFNSSTNRLGITHSVYAEIWPDESGIQIYHTTEQYGEEHVVDYETVQDLEQAVQLIERHERSWD